MPFSHVKDGWYYKEEKERSKIRFVKPDGAWSINLTECPLSEFIKLKGAKFVTEKGTYTIPSEYAYERGFQRMMKGELKLIIPLKNFALIPHDKEQP
jgi:hypothetical protein